MNIHRQKSLHWLSLPAAQRQVLTFLAREGPTDAVTLAQALGQARADLQNILSALLTQEAITLDANGHVAAQWGRTRRRAVPARLWPALQAANRLYSTQEIATLRIVVPILQFARARLGEFTDHGPGHVLRVKSFATQLGYMMGLTAKEQHLLRAAALFHDVGNVMGRATHHITSQETVAKLAESGQLPFSQREAALVGLLCRWHRKDYDPNRTDEWQGETIRTGLAASLLRVADALDSDYRRVDYGDKYKRVLHLFYPEELPFLQDLDTILGIRLCYQSHLHIQVFVQPQAEVDQSYHIRALRQDVADTPLDYTVQVFQCGVRSAPSAIHPSPPAALLVSPFDPHSLVMAALSRKHLIAAGYAVDLLIYPEMPDATAWLWREGLAEHNPAAFAHLVVIGDRPDSAITPILLAQLARWQKAGTSITILNRHEANWARLPDLLCQEPLERVTVTLGSDWAYFWGDTLDEADFFWGSIAALCTRDPIQSTVGLTIEQQTISQGLLKAVYDGIATTVRQSSNDDGDWVALAMPILDRIAADERAWFATQAAAFPTTYATLTPPDQIEGKVLCFDLTTTPTPHAIFWGLEAAIEQQGRTLERGICFKTPYAIATWFDSGSDPGSNATQEEKMVELLAINHWREEEATPIRLLYPTESGPTPEGNECAIRVRLPAAQVAQVVQALIAACNEKDE